mmetsp:Transcript_15775/g.45449  ORF Transcript_15775/g.45449 Transcript_15775/m.45449 type:complete len:698 (-) Transcript_15775:171-2264(-)|eukprot:CAMPEP_0181050826 /NCGR_PEP_ID=MMETSP1070-20121207/16722_1 /TAXON_ID=265543 /ORGANISM="Minutocellus polymorphus, Strain NH13" /LENGTH=697 /DNA_ID=CAMNT_0023129795 /DNA_START=9 /DNA_END=2102 /DNA_ORIENTATION=+
MTLHDPYVESKPPPPVDASVLDLLRTDCFFDQSKGYYDPDAAIIGELSAVDDEIDSCKRLSNLKDVSANTTEGQMLAELCSVDRLIDTHRKERVAEGDLFDCYCSRNNAKAKNKNKKNGIVPHLHAPAMYQSGDDAPTLMNLLSTDELVDGKRIEQEAFTANAHALHMDLLFVDAEMDHARYQVERPATVLDTLHSMDNDIDRIATAGSTARTTSVTACGSTVSSSEKGSSAVPTSAIEAELAAAGLTGILADLYSMDRRIDGAADACRTKDDVAAILELYNIDVKMGHARKKSTSDATGIAAEGDGDLCDKILLDLFQVDTLVENAGKSGLVSENEDAGERLFVDPHEAAAMRQVQLHAARDLHDEARIGAIMDLLRTDLDIDGRRHHDTDMEGIQALLNVDRSIDGSKAASCLQHDISDVLPLLEVDQIVDRHKSKGAAFKQQSSVPSDPMEYMVYVDRLVDGTTFRKSQEKINEMFGDLRRNDESVDSLFMPDIFGGFGDDVSNLPPPPVFDDESNSNTGNKDNVSETPYERQTREAIGQLLEVDQEVGAGHKAGRRDDPEMLVMLDLFKVDIEVDKAKLAALKSIGGGGSNASAPPSPVSQENQGEGRSKRSIFSSKEKRSSMEHSAGSSSIVGTTTRVNPRKKIGSIPLGEVVTSKLHEEFFGEAEMAPIDPYAPRTGSQSEKEKDEQCSIM